MIEFTTPQQVQIGDLIEGRFLVERMLGEGATGSVALARDTQLEDQLIALKFLHSHLLFSQASYGRFRTETRVTMSLNHPNIIHTYGLGQHSRECLYIRMEYLEGQTLAHYIHTQDDFDLERAIAILRDIAVALDYAHSRGVIHRDLKPENILLDRNLRPKIADFGLAQMIRLEARYTGYGDILGTPLYISPEQLRSEAVDGRSDMYSFGILAFELLTGNPPFYAESFIELAELHLHQRLPDFEAPIWLEQLLRECTAKNRLERPQSMADVANELDAHCELPRLSKKSSQPIMPSSSRLAEAGPPKMRYRMQRIASRWLRRVFYFFLLMLIIIIPRKYDTVQWRLGGAVFYFERLLGFELVPLRLLTYTRLDIRYPDSLFVHPRTNKQDLTHIRPLLMAGFDPNIKSETLGTYPLYLAVKINDSSLTKRYLESGADPNLVDSSGLTGLGHLVRLSIPDPQVLKVLLEYGADPNILVDNVPSPLAMALKLGNAHFADMLLRKGHARADIPSHDELPFLHLGIQLDNPRIVELILARGGKTSDRDINGRTALEFARSRTDLLQINEILRLLERSEQD